MRSTERMAGGIIVPRKVSTARSGRVMDHDAVVGAGRNRPVYEMASSVKLRVANSRGSALPLPKFRAFSWVVAFGNVMETSFQSGAGLSFESPMNSSSRENP